MPITIRQRLLDLLAIGRVSNLPTVWSNVIVGFLLAWCSGWLDESFVHACGRLGILLAGVTCAYLFGTFLNDWKDVEFDRAHRPERAIPSGRWSSRAILRFAIFFALVAGGSFLFLGLREISIPIVGLLLLGSIVIYTWIHKKSPLAIIPMGLCRSFLYALGFLVVTLPETGLFDFLGPSVHHFTGTGTRGDPLMILVLMALGIFSYVAGLTLAARYESRPESLRIPKAFLWFLIFFPFLTHTWWWLGVSPPYLAGWKLAIPTLIGLLPFLLWTARALIILKSSIPRFVARALAGLCLVDLLAFPGIAATIRTGWLPLDSYALLLALIPIVLFLLALVLQRIAPAT